MKQGLKFGDNNNLKVNYGADGKGEFNFDINVYSSDNLAPIDALYMPDEDGRIPENAGVQKINFPQEWKDAYTKGFFSTLGKQGATFNDAIFNMIRGFMARVVLDRISEQVHAKEHEKVLRNDDGVRAGMRDIADKFPPGSSPEVIQKELKDEMRKRGLSFPDVNKTTEQNRGDIPLKEAAGFKVDGEVGTK